MVMLESYGSVDLEEDPCIFTSCGHVFTLSTMDGMMEVSKHYELDETRNGLSIKVTLEAFSSRELPTCPSCRGPLRDIARYGRIVRRALLDESAKKFTSWSNAEHNRLARGLQAEYNKLLHSQGNAVKVVQNLTLTGDIDTQLEAIKGLRSGKRYRQVLALRQTISAFAKKLQRDEQPFQRVKDLVESIRRQPGSGPIGQFVFHDTELQLREHLQGVILLHRCDVVLLSDIIGVHQRVPPTSMHGTIQVNFTSNRGQCEAAIDEARKTFNFRQLTEARVLWARFAALECNLTDATHESSLQTDLVGMEDLKDTSLAHLKEAEALCDEYPRPPRGLKEDIIQVREMLKTATFSSEMRMVVAAMATEFSGTGHWYRCVRGHPFTVGECGMLMELAKCPACGAGIGGQSHHPTEGVTHAHDIEGRFGSLNIS